MQLDCALLFAMLRDKDLVSKLPTLEVVATDFKHPQHGRAYRFICKHLQDHGALPSTAVVKQVCQVDIEDSDVAPGFALAEFLKRKLFGRVSSGIETVGDSLRKNDPEGAYALMRGLVESIRPGSTIVTPREVASLGHKVIELYEKVKGGYQGVPCVWPSINDTTMGLWPKTTNYYVARAGIGKTWVVWLQARHAWRAGYRVLCVSPEMSEEECVERFFLIESRVSAHQVLRGNLSDFAYERLKSSIEERKNDKGLYIIDMDDDLSWQGIESAIRSCKPQLVCLDSIYMIGQGRDRTERTIRTTDWLRKISKRYGEEYGTAFVGFHQLSRAAVQSKKAGGVGYEDAAVALTDQIFWDAHSLWIMEQDADMRADKRIRFHCRKIRRGVWRSKPVDVYWDFDNMRFDEIVSQEDDFVDHEFDDTDKGKTTPF